ncbi:MAG: hypothetical protein HC897_20265, partial [Thermoanaerobaculia bacterium]|nr:hypothetical protein [Thermoanaerobaculia bacterium]
MTPAIKSAAGNTSEPRAARWNYPSTNGRSRQVTRWLVTHFGAKLDAAGAGTPFSADLLCAIENMPPTGAMPVPEAHRFALE